MTDGRPLVRRAAPSRAPVKRRGAVPLADLVAPCIEPAAAKRGFAAADLVVFWTDIVGERLARTCEPIKLQWPPRPRDGKLDQGAQTASLVVRVDGAFALELQHMSAVVVERINAHLGWRCVAKLVLRQAPLLHDRRPRRDVEPPDPAARARAAETAAAIADDALREAVTRLGTRVLSTPCGKARPGRG